MKARFFLSPLDAPLSEFTIRKPTRLADLFQLPQNEDEPPADVVEVMEWFADGGQVRINGHLIPPDRWARVTLKPHKAAEITLVYVPQGKRVFSLLATVALIALTTAITGGLAAPFLGAGFAAGTFGATALAAGVGLAGSLALSALTAPPKVSNQEGAQRELSQAGVSGNALDLLDTLPVVIGKMGLAPPMLAPFYTEWDGDQMTAYAIVGVQGRCLIENVRLNGQPIGDFGAVTYETREGAPGETARTMFTKTVIEERDGVQLSNFITDLEAKLNEQLVDQAVPDNSSPKWHPFQTAGNWTQIVLRFMFPAGLVYTGDGTPAFVPLRIEMRKKGDVSWRRLPTFHFVDVNRGNGPMRAEIRLIRSKQPGGVHFCNAGSEYPIHSANNYTAIGRVWAYESDSYFGSGETYDAVGLAPNMTNYTTSGVTISASSDALEAAWKIADSTGVSTGWQPANNSLPAWVKFDFGSAVTARSYQLKSRYTSGAVTPTDAPLTWYLEGSNDNATWVNLGNINNADYGNQQVGVYQFESPGSYRYYRLTVTANNGAANQAMRISDLRFFSNDANGSVYGQWGGSGEEGFTAIENTSISGRIKCRYVSLNKRGADVYLDPDEWGAGEYEIRVKRGWSGAFNNFGDTTNYSYSAAVGNTYYFDAQLVSSKYVIFAGQKNYRSDATIEAFQTIDENESPFDGTGIALIGVAFPSGQINSIYGEFTRYAAEWDGSIWNATEVPTQNPAALYRQILLGGANARPVPGDAIDEDGLADWFETCDAEGYQANAILQGARVAEAKQLIATAGYASPRDADTYGVIEDKDTSAEPLRYLITPQNSTDLRVTQELPDLPDAIRAEYNDEDLTYAINHATVYRDGVTEATAKVFETVSYPGFTNATKVAARAAFDLRQAYLRQVRYSMLVGHDAITLQRGSLVGLSSDLVDGPTASGWVTEIEVSGSDVVSITLDNIMPWSAEGDVEAIEDISAITDIVDPSQPMGVVIRIPGGEVIRKQVSDVSDSNVCTFTTPFPYVGSGLDTVDLETDGLLVVAGTWTNTVRRCKVMSVVPQPDMRRMLVLADEAEGLFS